MSLANFFKKDVPIARFATVALLALAVGGLGLRPAHAITRAGSTINNQAIGVYGDGSDVPRTVTSNSVQTVVQPVAFLNLSSDGTKNATSLSTVNFSHTITNTGNDTDVFNLFAIDQTGDDFQALPVVRADANGDGIPDGILPITKTPSLQPGESFSFVISTTAAGLVSGNSAKILVRATSQFDSAVTSTNTDTLNITTGAQVSVVKSIDKASGAPGSGPYTYTLTYTNSGNSDATNLTITDVLVPGLSYVPGSGRWSTSGATALGDGLAGDPAGINYTYGLTGLTVSAVVARVPANTTGRLSFQVNLDNGLLPGILGNVALYTYNDGLNLIGLTPTNTVNLTVNQLASFDFTGATVASANQGSNVDFANVIKNTGSGTDTFDITLAPLNTFPLGTTYQLMRGPANNLTPMTDSNGNGILDTGPVQPGANFTVTLRATLPTIALGSGPFSVTKIATSSISPLVIHTATDTLTSVTSNTVDLTNDAAGALGAGAGPESSPVTILPAGIGTTQRFTLYVKNTGAVADSYVLLASADTAFAGLNLPAGFTVVFKSDAGGILTNTGPVQPGATVKVNADVFVPLGAIPGTQNVYFRVLSLLTGATDTKLDALNIGGLRSLAVGPNGVGQLYPGNATVYTHTITNTGNLAEGDALLNNSTIALATTDSVTGFSSVIYRDANGNGTLDETDPIVNNLDGIVLLPRQSATIFVKVYAAAGTDLGAVNTTTLTATTTGGLGTPPAVVTLRDSSTVIAGQVRMEKTQALSNGGTLVYSVNRITTGAKPGAVIRYRIVATNVGTAPALGFVITDAIPSFTAYDQGDGTNSGTGVAGWTDGTTFHPADTPLANGATGTLNFTIGQLDPGQSATVTFGVKIQ